MSCDWGGLLTNFVLFIQAYPKRWAIPAVPIPFFAIPAVAAVLIIAILAVPVVLIPAFIASTGNSSSLSDSSSYMLFQNFKNSQVPVVLIQNALWFYAVLKQFQFQSGTA